MPAHEAPPDRSPAATGEVTILRVRVRELEAFAVRTAEEARRGGVVAISPERARSQARNPYAAPDDVGLLVAYVDGRCEGYGGLLPGRLRQGGRDHPVRWMTAWYTSPRVRGKQVAYRLVRAAFEERHGVFTTVFSEDAARVARTTMDEIPGLQYRIVDLRRAVPWSLLLRRLARGRAAEDLLPRVERAAFAPARAAVLALLCARYARAAGGVRAEQVSALDDDDFAPVPADAVRFLRGAPVVNWMLAHPWLREAPAPPDDAWSGYFFSRTRPVFRYEAYRFVTRESRRAGFAVVAVSEERGHRSVRLLDHEFRSPPAAAALLGQVLRTARRWKADSLVLSDSLAPALRSPVWRLLSRPAVRPYFAHLPHEQGELAPALARVELDRCDADAAFV